MSEDVKKKFLESVKAENPWYAEQKAREQMGSNPINEDEFNKYYSEVDETISPLFKQVHNDFVGTAEYKNIILLAFQQKKTINEAVDDVVVSKQTNLAI